MLKDRKLRQDYIFNKDYYGYVMMEGFDGPIYGKIQEDDIIREIDDEEYYFAEVRTSASDSDYHTFCFEYDFNGVLLAFNLNTLDTLKYFGEDFSEKLFPKTELCDIIEVSLKRNGLVEDNDYHDVYIENGVLRITIPNKRLDREILDFGEETLGLIRRYYCDKGVHITRMFGSYILLKKINGELKAERATSIPIEYCPLMVKLLKEVGGDAADSLLENMRTGSRGKGSEAMCRLIDEVVIKAGYFDTNRPLNSCEANVLFGASETISSAFRSKLIDAAVIVSNNLGTIITTNDISTQGAVKRMTGLFYTSPSEQIVLEARNSGIIPVFPYTASIDQVEGVKEAIRRGYKRIAVTLASHDNVFLEKLKGLEKEGVTIYKFGLCSTGIDKETAGVMSENADVVWSCASKYVKEIIEPAAIAQIGVKIPVHIMTKKGWDIVKNHLMFMENSMKSDNINLCNGEEKPVFLNSNGKIIKLSKRSVQKCNDCPRPCI